MDPQNNQQNQPQAQNQGGNNQNNIAHNTADNSMVMSVLSYLGPLVLVSYFTSKDNPTVKFHVKQGLALFGIEVIIYVVASMMWSLWMIFNLINLGTLVLSIIGIINVTQGKQKELPLIGSFANGLKV